MPIDTTWARCLLSSSENAQRPAGGCLGPGCDSQGRSVTDCVTLGELLGSREPQLSSLPGDDTASRYSVMTLKVIWDLTDTTTPRCLESARAKGMGVPLSEVAGPGRVTNVNDDCY